MTDHKQLTDADLRRINLELSQTSQEQRNDVAPDRLPRLSKPPKTAREAA